MYDKKDAQEKNTKEKNAIEKRREKKIGGMMSFFFMKVGLRQGS